MRNKEQVGGKGARYFIIPVVLLLSFISTSVLANTYNLTAPNRPAICSGNQGTWSGNTYICDWGQPLQLSSGDIVLSNNAVTLRSRNGMTVNNVTFGGNGYSVSLQADGGSTIELQNSELFGSITNTPNVSLTDGTIVHGNITTSSQFSAVNSSVGGTVQSGNNLNAVNSQFQANVSSNGQSSISSSTVAGNLSSANAINATDTIVQGTTTSTNGSVSFSGGEAIGLLTSGCCKVTVSNYAVVQNGITASNNGIEISNSSVAGDLTANNNPIVLTNVMMSSGTISAGQNNVTIVGGEINADIPNAHRVFISDDAEVYGDIKARFEVRLTNSTAVGDIETTSDHDGLHHVYLTGSTVYGNVIVRSDWGTITGDWPNSAIYGDCTYHDVTPSLCSEGPGPGGPTDPEVDHYRIYHPPEIVSCFTAPITVMACADSDCNNGYAEPFQFEIGAGISNVNWQGPGVTATANGSASVAAVGAESHLGLTHLPEGVVTLSISNSAPSTVGPTRCFNTSSSVNGTRSDCQIDFKTAGLMVGGEHRGEPVPNQYSGEKFSSYLWAVETNTSTGACEARVEGEQSVAFGVECLDPATCSAGTDYIINGNAVGKADSNVGVQYSETEVTFNADGRALLTNNYPDVGLFRMHAQLTLPEEPNSDNPDINDPAITLSGTSLNDYVLRPYRLVIVPVDKEGNTFTATKKDGVGFQAAGSEFTVFLQSENEDGTVTPNFGNEARTIEVSAIVDSVLFPDDGELGVLEGLAKFEPSGSLPGTFENNELTWSEVGTINLAARLVGDDYLGAGDANERPLSPVGRFFPYKFVIEDSIIVNACTVDGFTYMGQPEILIEFTLNAVNKSGLVTTNYDRSNYKGVAQVSGVAANVSPVDSVDDKFITRLELDAGADWVNGVLKYEDDALVFNRLNNGIPDGPFPETHIGLQISDELDNRGFDAGDMNLITQLGEAAALEGTLNLVYGRMTLENSYGPEQEDLRVDLKTQVWNGNNFELHIADNCTPYQVANLSLLHSHTTTSQPGGYNGMFTEGQVPLGGLVWLAPTNAETFDEFAFEYDAPPWLEFRWGYDNAPDAFQNPRAFGSFGQYRGSDRIIFWLELR